MAVDYRIIFPAVQTSAVDHEMLHHLLFLIYGDATGSPDDPPASPNGDPLHRSPLFRRCAP
jgi:hypothetical protein